MKPDRKRVEMRQKTLVMHNEKDTNREAPLILCRRNVRERSHSTPQNRENPNENEESHTRRFGYPQNPSVTVNFRASRGCAALQRVRGPPEERFLFSSRGETSLRKRVIPPEGPASPRWNLEDVPPSRAPCSSLPSRDSYLRSHWSIRYMPSEDSFVTAPEG